MNKIATWAVLLLLVLSGVLEVMNYANTQAALLRTAQTQEAQLARIDAIARRLDALAAFSSARASVLDRPERAEPTGRAETQPEPPRTGPDPAARPAPRAPAGDPAERDLILAAATERGTALFAARRFSEARSLLAGVLQEQPENRGARLYHALSLYYENPGDSGRYGHVEAELQGFDRGSSADPRALRVLGLLAMERASWDEAAARFGHATALAPESAFDHKMAGVCSLRLGDAAAARRELERAVILEPGDAEAWYYAGAACSQGGQPQEALERFERCLDIEEGFAAARLGTANALLVLGRAKEALEALEPAARTAEASLLAGDCHRQLGDTTEARDAWLEALRLLPEAAAAKGPSAAAIYLRLARSAYESAAYADCVSFCKEGLQRDAQPMLKGYLGAALVAMGKVREGQRLLEELSAESPQGEAGRFAAAVLAGETPPRQAP